MNRRLFLQYITAASAALAMPFSKAFANKLDLSLYPMGELSLLWFDTRSNCDAFFKKLAPLGKDYNYADESTVLHPFRFFSEERPVRKSLDFHWLAFVQHIHVKDGRRSLVIIDDSVSVPRSCLYIPSKIVKFYGPNHIQTVIKDRYGVRS